MVFGQPKSQVPVEPLWRRLVDVLWYPPAERRWQQKRRRERAQAGLTASSFESQELSWKFLFYRVSAYSLLAWLGGMMSAYLFAGPVGALGITLGFLIIYICFTLGVLVMLA